MFDYVENLTHNKNSWKVVFMFQQIWLCLDLLFDFKELNVYTTLKHLVET